MAEVSLEQIGKTYPGGVEAVRDVQLRVNDGELIALVGPSGSGKTTLLRMIAGLETPTTGIIRIGGRVVNDVPPHRRDVAMVFQRPALYPHLSVRANLGFRLTLRQGRRWWDWFGSRRACGENAAEIDNVARQLGLENVLDRRPGTLSGGQQQRVALGRALVRRPAVFLFDEPLSNLDARLRLEMRRELHLLHRRLRATMIYVTHDQDEAMTLGERVVVLDRGAIRQADCPQALYDRPADRLVAGFLGWPPMNFLDGELVVVGDRLSFGNWDGCLITSRLDWRPFVGRPLTLGIRAEDVRLAEGPGENQLTMVVRLVERLGPVQLATLTMAAWTVTARLAVTPALSEGETVHVAFDLTRAHLFDPATGRALCHGHVSNAECRVQNAE
ncbi:MAG TPA: ABC transporter ATP-binding protein [Gemmataceae bacterium]|nr:ABC transporter ATP-binding protein [Gemmataceae bacterium]